MPLWTLASRRDTSTESIERSPARRRDHLHGPCSPHRFGEAAPERVAEMVDVGQFLGLRAAKRAGPSAPAAGQLGIFASESEPIPQHAVRFSAWQIVALFMTLAAIASVPILLYPWPPLSRSEEHTSALQPLS